MSTAKERFDAFPSYEKEVRERLGDEGADKANAIIAILQIGDQRSVAYSKAILAAAEMALERRSTFPSDETGQ
jgi:hypothetical protein